MMGTQDILTRIDTAISDSTTHRERLIRLLYEASDYIWELENELAAAKQPSGDGGGTEDGGAHDTSCCLNSAGL